MISYEGAFDTVLASVPLMDSETVPLENAPGRVLARDVHSDVDMPPFRKSAMDGYACRRSELTQELTIVETIPAGHVPARSIEPGECAKIMTGAMLPAGADCVVMVEFSEQPSETTVRFTTDTTQDNICGQGEDVGKDDIVLTKGTWIRPQHIGLLAAVGCANPPVARRPCIGILATGDELVEAEDLPGAAQIRNSNSHQLLAQSVAAGGDPTYYGIAHDTGPSLRERLAQATEHNDLLLVSGGVSAGDYDLVPPMLKEAGFELVFEKVAVKPGMPTVFGRRGRLACFGLPGNPVSTFLIFEILVRPFLCRMMGHDYRPSVAAMPLAQDVVRKKTGRASWIPVCRTSDHEAMPLEYHGSAHLRALCRADGLIKVPAGVAELKKGTLVHVRQV